VIWKTVRGFKLSRVAPLVMFVPMPLLMNFFAVAMGINHQKKKNNQAGNNQDDDNRLIPPYLANKFGHIRIHAT
jgi:hypothetical protein